MNRCNECGFGRGWHARNCGSKVLIQTAPAIKPIVIQPKRPKKPSELPLAIMFFAMNIGCLFFTLWVIKTIWSIV